MFSTNKRPFCGVKHGLLHFLAFLYKIRGIFSMFWGILNINMTNVINFTVFRDDIRFLSDQMWPKWVKTDILTFRMAKYGVKMDPNIVCVCCWMVSQRLSSESIFLTVTAVGDLVWKGWLEGPTKKKERKKNCLSLSLFLDWYN